MSSRRTFEHVLLDPSPRGEKGRERVHTVRYERLMRVSIRHTYYNGSNRECPDFEIRPTPFTATLMQSLGLLFKSERAGFSVLYNGASAESLLDYLRGETSDGSNPPQVWARLSFVLSLTNPYFVNFTDISIDTNPTEENFYFTNQYAHHAADGAIVINPDEVGNDFALDTIEVVPTQLSVSMDKNVKEVHVLDISGEVVTCRPRCVPKSLLKEKPPTAITCADAAGCTADDNECKCTNTVYLDFSLLPEDKYTIELINYGDTVGSPPVTREILYTMSYPLPLCFIDLLFTRPTSEEPGIYPVENLFPKEATRIVPVNYEIWFNNRATFWNYYVVPPPRERYEDLFIRSEPPVEFAGPCCVNLPDGTTAYRFLSQSPIPLQEESIFKLQLRNNVLPGHDDVIVKRLPVASSNQVLPEQSTDTCRILTDSLCPLVDQGESCIELVDFVCHSSESPPQLFEKIYSDIYVHV